MYKLCRPLWNYINLQCEWSTLYVAFYNANMCAECLNTDVQVCLVLFKCLCVLDYCTALDWVYGWNKSDEVYFSPLLKQLLALFFFFLLFSEVMSSYWVYAHSYAKESVLSRLKLPSVAFTSSYVSIRATSFYFCYLASIKPLGLLILNEDEGRV